MTTIFIYFTITKFNRMGKLAGLGSKNVQMIRCGYMADPQPNAVKPIQFSHNIDAADYEESWSDSLMMYHNPKAIHPVDLEWFKTISHILIDKKNGKFEMFLQPYDVLSSVTLTLLDPEKN